MTDTSPQFDSVLVANRGEIACRILRTVRAMGLKGIGVFSEADADANHVRLADEAICIGPAPASESYLSIERVLAAALETGAGAIHPGYGFLSENADFAAACEGNGIVLVGPSAAAIAAMGNKAAARRTMREAGVPCVPGDECTDQSDAALLDAGKAIGFPLMVKAAAGGGGRGLRRVTDVQELPDAIALARSEAHSSFGCDELILEKALEDVRHVEVQVLADNRGKTLHLAERDCSIQRRHQKIIEEAPCPVMTPALRETMGKAAVTAAQAIGYAGAGTVEFLLDADGAFYFLEMNTRLQVEHPVTEMVIGLDLVEWQIRIAAGEPLTMKQSDIVIDGHAIEARLYTEDPDRDFLPTTGRIELWEPANRDHVRVDDGVRTGTEITPFYDALAAKIIAWGETRDEARLRLVEALAETVVFGPATNKSFLIACLEHRCFADGEATTAFIDNVLEDIIGDGSEFALDAAIAAVLFYQSDRVRAFSSSTGVSTTLADWSSGIPLTARYELRIGENTHHVAVIPRQGDRYRVRLGETEHAIELNPIDDRTEAVMIDGHTVFARFQITRRGLWLAIDGRELFFSRFTAGSDARRSDASSGSVAAKMHGVVQSIEVSAGEHVEKGQRLLVMEAMKMQQDIVAPVEGRVAAIEVSPGRQVATGDVLLIIEDD